MKIASSCNNAGSSYCDFGIRMEGFSGSSSASVSFQAAPFSSVASSVACIYSSRREVPDSTERSNVATESVDGIVADAAVYTTLQTVEKALLHSTSMR